MRIGLNATCFDARPSGANQRFRTLYGAVIRRNPSIRFLIYEPRDYPVARWFSDAANVEARRTPLPASGRVARLLCSLGYWHRAFREDRLDLFESFHLPLIRASCPSLLTLHDLRMLRPEGGWPGRTLGRVVLRQALRSADHVITVSDSMREEILAFRPGTAISTVYNAVDAESFRLTDLAASGGSRHRDLPEAYMLTVGHLEARKNLLLLIDAVARLRDQGLDRPLVIAGRDGGMRHALIAHVAARGLGGHVRLIEDADDADIRRLYAGCRLVVVASRYEGFGIPVVEAMAARRPLVTSDIPVFGELTGGQGRHFPVDDPSAAAAAIESVWSDPREQDRLVAQGDARVDAFAVHRLADRISALYRQLSGDVPRISAMRERAAATE